MSEGSTTPTPPTPLPPPQQPYGRRRRNYCGCERCGRRSLMGPAILITLGVLFMVSEFTWRVNFGDLWPIILIVIGVIKLLEFSASTEGHKE